MKRNKQSKYRMKLIQEFHLNKVQQKWNDRTIKDYKRAYNILKGKSKVSISAFKPQEFKFKDMKYSHIDDIDRNSTIPSMMISMELKPASLEKYYKTIGGK